VFQSYVCGGISSFRVWIMQCPSWPTTGSSQGPRGFLQLASLDTSPVPAHACSPPHPARPFLETRDALPSLCSLALTLDMGDWTTRCSCLLLPQHHCSPQAKCRRRLLPRLAATHSGVSHGRRPSWSSGRRHRTSTWPGHCALPRREQSSAAGTLWPSGSAQLILIARSAPQRRHHQSACSRAAAHVANPPHSSSGRAEWSHQCAWVPRCSLAPQPSLASPLRPAAASTGDLSVLNSRQGLHTRIWLKAGA
jgi:hypothetical protein